MNVYKSEFSCHTWTLARHTGVARHIVWTTLFETVLNTGSTTGLIEKQGKIQIFPSSAKCWLSNKIINHIFKNKCLIMKEDVSFKRTQSDTEQRCQTRDNMLKLAL